LGGKVIKYMTISRALGFDMPEEGKGKTVTKNGKLVKGVVAAFMMMGTVACSTIASPPVGQIVPTNHAALVGWYDKEAVQLRGKAKDMEDMKARYLKYPALIAIEGMHNAKIDFQLRCNSLIGPIYEVS
jgi:hypothetical protein